MKTLEPIGNIQQSSVLNHVKNYLNEVFNNINIKL